MRLRARMACAPVVGTLPTGLSRPKSLAILWVILFSLFQRVEHGEDLLYGNPEVDPATFLLSSIDGGRVECKQYIGIDIVDCLRASDERIPGLKKGVV